MVDNQSTSINEEIKSALKNWKTIVAKYQKPDKTKATFQILNSFLPFIALWILIYISLDYSLVLAAGLALINAFFLVRIFIIQHDCGHQSFFKSKKLNHIIGTICSVCSFIPFKYWAKSHSYHHGHSGQLEVHHIGDIPTITVDEYRSRSFWENYDTAYSAFRW